MSRKSRFRKKQKNKGSFVKKTDTTNNFDSQIEQLIENKEYSKIISLLIPLLEENTITEKQLSHLAFAFIEEEGKEGTEKALNCIEKIKNLTFKDRRVKGWCFIYQENWDEAIAILEKLYQEDKTSQSLYALCVALLKSRNISELFGKQYYWSEVREELKDDKTISKVKNLLLEGLKNKTVYLAYFRWLEEIWFYENNEQVYEDRRNIKILKDALTIFPDEESLRLDLVNRYAQINDLENITDTLDWALNNPTASGKIFVDSIQLFLRENKPEKALEFFEKANELELFAGEEKEVLRVEILYKSGKVKEANLYVDEIYSNSEASQILRFGLMTQRVLYEISVGDFDGAVKNLLNVSKIWKEISQNESDYSGTPDVAFGYENQNKSIFPHYVLHSEEIDSIINSSIKNSILLLKDLDNTDLEIVYEYLIHTYEIVSNSKEQVEELEQLLNLATNRNLNTEKIWLNLYYIDLNSEEYITAIEKYLEYCFSCLETNNEIKEALPQTSWDNENRKSIPFVEVIDKKIATTIHKNLLKKLKPANLLEREKIFLPLFVGFWSKLLKHNEMYEKLVELAKSFSISFPNDTDILWLHAYYSEQLNASYEAEKSYRHLLEIEPENSSVLHNLALIVNKFGNNKEAIELSDKAFKIAPNDELISRINKELHQETKEFEAIIPNWNSLDFYKKSILNILKKSNAFPSNSSLAREIGHNIQERAISGHLKKLQELGWYSQDEKGGWRLNKFVSKLLSLSDNQFQIGNPTSPTVTISTQTSDIKLIRPIKTEIVHLDNRNPIKPIFNSNNEFIWYQEFTTFFPNYHVIPNMSLQTIFKYDTMKVLLNPEDFNYYLMASVDICVISTQDFLPKFGFELDSIYHDDEKQIVRDERKNRIFITANLPLIRVRKDGVITREEIRNNIQESLESIPDYFKSPTKPKLPQTIELNEDGEAVF